MVKTEKSALAESLEEGAKKQPPLNASTLSRFYGDSDIKPRMASQEADKKSWKMTFILAYTALGVIYGDIGTSPLYTWAAIFPVIQPQQDDILGAMSLIFWTLTLVVLCKYILVVLHANDQGEGGTFALYTRLCRTLGIDPSAGAMSSGRVMSLEVHQEMVATHKALRGLSRGSRTLGGDNFNRSSGVNAVPALPPASENGDDTSKKPWFRLHPFDANFFMSPFRKYAAARVSLIVLSMVSTSLIIGDGILTPAISVVSAVSGLQVGTSSVTQTMVVGISCAILVILFAFQSFGTHRVGFLFSPIVIIWMLSIAGIGIYDLWLYSGTTIIQGLSPHYIGIFFQNQGLQGFYALGGVMLSVTGSEALFADLGHFSIASIQISFSFFCYPCLILNYLGQGAYLIDNPSNISTSFWSSIPSQYFWPMLVIATSAAVVASQALITGSFSLIRQAMKLGAFPTLEIVHTGKKVEGQIYIGAVNWILCILCIAVVAGFNGSGTAIGYAYGLAISTTFLITTFLIFLCMVIDWKVSWYFALTFWIFYSIIDGAFLAANMTKVPLGAWFTLAVTAGVILIMLVWRTGSYRKRKALHGMQPKVDLTHLIAPAASIAQGSNLHAMSAPADATPQHAPPTNGGGSRISAASTPIRKTTIGAPSGAHTVFQLPEEGGPRRRVAKAHPGHSFPNLGLATRSRRLGTDLVARNSTPIVNPGSIGITIFPAGPIAEAVEVLKSNHQSLASEVQTAYVEQLVDFVGVSQLRGIGIYLTESSFGIPPVMWHFLRNVEAIHEFAILLEVRFLPIPFLPDEDRFSSVPVPGLPSIYRVAARYGYLDVVDLGPDFIDAVVKHIGEKLLVAATQELASESIKGLVNVERRLKRLDEAGEGEGEGEEGGPSMPHDLVPEPAPSDGSSASLELLYRAKEQGVVYYSGKTTIRMRECSNGLVQRLHDFWYSGLYKTLVLNCFHRIEYWKIPSESLVELGITVEI